MRLCDQCNIKIPRFRPRNKTGNGQMVCDGCADGKESRPVGYHGSVEAEDQGTAVFARLRTQVAEAETRKVAHDSGDGATSTGMIDTMQTLAHDSGDGATLYHCPFCFTENVRYITKDGVKSFGETVGTTQKVLTADPNGRTEGRWVDAHIHEFGEQSIMRVTLRRNQRVKVIEATPEHRWLVKAELETRPSTVRISRKGLPRDFRPTHCVRGHELIEANVRVKKNGTRDCKLCTALSKPVGGISRSTDRDVITRDLCPGMRLSFLRASVGNLVPDEDGIRHGIVFGDGSAQGKRANVTLWGEKDKQLLRYFPNRKYVDDNTSTRVLGTGVPGVRVSGDLWSWMKSIPQSTSSVEYLYGWLAGYFAADGCVSKQGAVRIASANLAHLEAVRDVGLGLGISTYGITMVMRVGFKGREPSPLYSMEFVGSTLNESFFLIEKHRDRFRFRNYAYERLGWTVVSVDDTGRVEPVYCAVVPELHSFALEDNIWVGNCGGGQVVAGSDGTVECGFCLVRFTVQVQPEHASMPQTVNGVPQDIPGMPGQVDPAVDPAAPGEVPEGDQAAQDPGTDGFVPPDAFAPPPVVPEPAPAVPGVAAAFYLNAEGMALPEESYLRHLAISFADDPAAVIAQVREERG